MGAAVDIGDGLGITKIAGKKNGSPIFGCSPAGLRSSFSLYRYCWPWWAGALLWI